jgi:hypothetical protein
MSILYKDDVGVHIIVHTSNKSIPVGTLSLILEKPSGTKATLAVTPTMINYNTGVITYDTIAGDLNEVGEYKIQVRGVFADADEVSNIDSFHVYDKL